MRASSEFLLVSAYVKGRGFMSISYSRFKSTDETGSCLDNQGKTPPNVYVVLKLLSCVEHTPCHRLIILRDCLLAVLFHHFAQFMLRSMKASSVATRNFIRFGVPLLVIKLLNTSTKEFVKSEGVSSMSDMLVS